MPANVQPTTLHAQQPNFELGSGETVAIQFDVTNQLASGESVQVSPAPTAKVVIPSQPNTAITGAVTAGPTANGNVLTVTITGTVLTIGQQYLLYVTYNATASVVKQIVETIIVPL